MRRRRHRSVTRWASDGEPASEGSMVGHSKRSAQHAHGVEDHAASACRHGVLLGLQHADVSQFDLAGGRGEHARMGDDRRHPVLRREHDHDAGACRLGGERPRAHRPPAVVAPAGFDGGGARAGVRFGTRRRRGHAAAAAGRRRAGRRRLWLLLGQLGRLLRAHAPCTHVVLPAGGLPADRRAVSGCVAPVGKPGRARHPLDGAPARSLLRLPVPLPRRGA